MHKRNIYKMQFGGNSWQSNFTKPNPFNLILPTLDLTKLQMGLFNLRSTDPLTRLEGNQMVGDVVQGAFDTGGTDVTPTYGRTPFSLKFTDSTFGRNFGAWNALSDIANTTFTGLFGEKEEYSGEKGDVSRTIDSTYDTILDIAGSLGPIGSIVSLGMGANKLLGNVANKLGGGTSGMTTADAILGSSFLLLTPFGLINGFGGSKADTITKDDLAFETVGASYTGSNLTVDDALTKSGKKYGLFSQKAKRKANREIWEARRLLDVISDIASDATDMFNILNSMSAIMGNRRAFNMLGGYDLSAIRVGRSGLKLTPAQARTIIQKCQKGKKIQDPFQLYLNSLPESQRDSTNFRVRDYWEFNGKPKDFEDAKSRGMFVLDTNDNSWHAYSVAENPSTGELEFMKSSTHPTILYELDWYNSDDAADFRSRYELLKTLPYWKYVKRKTPIKQLGGILEKIPTEIELVSIELIEEFQNGGSINVIPDGALHARKHNMDIKGITQKGIPVVSEKEGGELELQAEIEREEIIYRLEVTLELERLSKIYYDENSSKEDKEEASLKAGKLLVKETLYNTVDNTNLLL